MPFVLSRSDNRRQPFDFILRVSGRPVAVIEVKGERLIDMFDMSRIETYASEHDIRLVVVTDGFERFIVIDRRGKAKDKQELNFNGFIDLLQIKRQDFAVDIKREVAKVIFDKLVEYDQSFKNILPDFVDKLSNQLEYDEIDQRYYYKDPTGLESVESKIFLALLGNDSNPGKKVYRYTTLGTAYAMLNNNSFRMNCLIGMNDISEVSYAESYIYDSPKDFSSKNAKTIDAYNNRFISSCSLKEDDLTQWRLYGDECKGVCLVLNIGKIADKDFVVKKISYGSVDGKHRHLDLLKSIVAEIRIRFGIEFYFKSITTWRHFFKPYEYAIEEEVRILYIRRAASTLKKGWVLTASHNILNPYVDFQLNSVAMPVKLSEIVLGPKCPEKELNKCQFEQFIRELNNEKTLNANGDEVDKYNLGQLKVSISSITSYR